ncbi:MAG: hypothetical protein AB1631_00450 [Acidobacteriota bacterium]
MRARIIEVNTMSRQAVTVELPEEIYDKVKRAARATKRPVRQMLVSILKSAMPSLDEFPPEYRAELEKMETFSDEELLETAKARLSSTQQRRLNYLLRKNQAEGLNGRERESLTALSKEADRLTLCRAYAYLLLKQRGHPVPALAELKP